MARARNSPASPPAAGHRRVSALPATPRSRARAEAWLAACRDAGRRGLWVGPGAPAGLPTVRPAQLGHWLGREVDALVFEAGAVPAVDALVIAGGLLRGGGILLLLVELPADSPFGRRWQAALREGLVAWPDPARDAEWPCPPPAPVVHELAWTTEQREALRQLETLAPGDCGVLIAPRGRGKSTVLGEWLARRALAGCDVTLTAPGSDPAARALEHARAVAGAEHPALRYRAPDVLLADPEPVDTLLVDEAAALPVERLLRLVRRARRAILATTTGGFEGSGQGFRLRALPALEAAGFRVRQQPLATPVRWAEGDPLEAWLNDLFLLEARSSPPAPQAVRLVWTSIARLVRQPQRLEAVMGLLADAHYRTRPSDLQRWLDDPGVRLLILEGIRDRAVFGVALVQEEPGLEPPLAEAVWAGERRPQGHFLPCTLALQGGAELAGRTAWRVHRLAVHPRWQQRGLGMRLLREVLERARSEGVALVGASFGLQPGLQAFWNRAGLRLVRVGLRPDAASGQVAGVALTATAADAAAPLSRLQRAFARDWPQWRDHLFPYPAGEVARAVDRVAVTEAPAPPAGAAADWREVHAFAKRRRPLEAALPALLRRLAAEPPRDADGRRLAALLQPPLDWARLAAELGVSGRRGVTRRLRALAAAWVDAQTDP